MAQRNEDSLSARGAGGVRGAVAGERANEVPACSPMVVPKFSQTGEHIRSVPLSHIGDSPQSRNVFSSILPSYIRVSTLQCPRVPRNPSNGLNLARLCGLSADLRKQVNFISHTMSSIEIASIPCRRTSLVVCRPARGRCLVASVGKEN